MNLKSKSTKKPIEFLKTEWMKQEVKKSLNFGKRCIAMRVV